MTDLPENVTITTAEYLRLLRSDFTLTELEAAGVDNWDGYSEADWYAVDDGITAAETALGGMA